MGSVLYLHILYRGWVDSLLKKSLSVQNEFFYCFFGYRELKLFEREFSKFSTGRKSIAYNREFKKLLNKLQSV